MLRLIIIENSIFFRIGIKTAFKGNPAMYITGEASNDAALSGLLAGTPADVVLLGVNRPDDTAYLDVTRYIRCHYPVVKILAVANEDTARIVQSMMEAGINGFIGKRQADRVELEKAIRRVAAGEEYIGRIDSNHCQMVKREKEVES